MPEYTVRQGDCVSSIAYQFGVTSKTVWNHPNNAELKSKRKSINLLMPGDGLFVPDREVREISVATDSQHKFVQKGVPAKLRLRVLENNKTKANEPYTLNLDGSLLNGNTDTDGWIIHTIPPDAREAVLILKDGHEKYTLRLGHLDPIDETTGIQARLKNLGYYCGNVDGTASQLLEEAIRCFQKKRGLEETGMPDSATQDALKKGHGS